MRRLASLAVLPLLLPLFMLLSSAGVSACKKESASPPGATENAVRPATYTVKGIIRALPTAAGKPVTILHQAIPSFKDRAGEEVGMMSMPMPFTVASTIDLTGYAVGDKVEFTFEVRWQEGIPTHITALRKLPAEQEIDFSGSE